jgi:ribosomal protein L37AE/L43A
MSLLVYNLTKNKRKKAMIVQKPSSKLSQRFSIIDEKKEKEKEAIDYYIQVVYNGVLTCPRCHSTEKVYRRNDRPRLCQCNKCNNSFSCPAHVELALLEQS